MPGIVEEKSSSGGGTLDQGRPAFKGNLDIGKSHSVSSAGDPFSPIFQNIFPSFRSSLCSQLDTHSYDSLTTCPPSPPSYKLASPSDSAFTRAGSIPGISPIPSITVQTSAQEKPTIPEIRIGVPDITVTSVSGSGNIPEIEISESVTPTALSGGVGQQSESKQKLKFLLKDGQETVDVLHNKAKHPMSCTPNGCHGSVLMPDAIKKEGKSRTKDEIHSLAEDFINQYYGMMKMLQSTKHKERLMDVRESINALGTYEMTINELTFAAKTAWRNSARCIGRKQWTRLQVFDFRTVTTAYEMYEALCAHMRYATNGGIIRAALTLFPHHKYQGKDFKMWNKMIIAFAGYQQEDGSVIGDPSNVKFTKFCETFGWRGKGGRFDVLPWLLQAAGATPELYPIPEDLVLRVPISHPRYPGLAELGLEWYTVPGNVMLLDCGGLEISCPFNGWYMSTEISVRDFLDVNRYNLLPAIAEKMGLDVKGLPVMWKDLASVEMNIAVVTSFQNAGVTLSDQHTAVETFMSFLETENQERGGCPADWVWLVPPISGSLTPVFHQEMLYYRLTPSYEYQTLPWETEDTPISVKEPLATTPGIATMSALRTPRGLNRRMSMRRVRCTILYATETGKAERFARRLYKLFNQSFVTTMYSLDEYDLNDFKYEDMVLIVASTFGNGDPPTNGEKFASDCFGMMCPETCHSKSPATAMMAVSDNKMLKNLAGRNLLTNVRFSVFALGSSIYSSFCAFGRYLDSLLEALGGDRMFPRGEGDDLYGQAEDFWQWSQAVFKAACTTFCIEDKVEEIRIAVNNASRLWVKDKFRLEKVTGAALLNEREALMKIHGTRRIFLSKMKTAKQLQAASSQRQTILVELSADDPVTLTYQPGDHLCVYPQNASSLVDKILSKTAGSAADDVYALKICEGEVADGEWRDGRLPPCSLRCALTNYLDLTLPPEIDFVQTLQQFATDEKDVEKIHKLTADRETFEAWKCSKLPSLGDIVDEFPSILFPVEFVLSEIPVLKPRLYSISSAPEVHQGEIHLTVAVVRYRTEGEEGSEHLGVCSTWLGSIGEGHPVYCSVRSSKTFHLPEIKCAPVLMVGPGTGIAPFRGFWQHRSMEIIANASKPKPEKFGSVTLYFGCREPDVDDILKEERDTMLKHGVLNAQFTAYSRQTGRPKVYVQHLMGENKDAIYRQVVEEGGHVYVCGDSSMAADVRQQIETIFHQVGGVTMDEARAAVTLLRERNRYHEDIFGATFNLKEKLKATVPKAKQGSLRRASCIEPIQEVPTVPFGNQLFVPTI